jgi:hypothetical protein
MSVAQISHFNGPVGTFIAQLRGVAAMNMPSSMRGNEHSSLIVGENDNGIGLALNF